jgi:hypothetical protein
MQNGVAWSDLETRYIAFQLLCNHVKKRLKASVGFGHLDPGACGPGFSFCPGRSLRSVLPDVRRSLMSVRISELIQATVSVDPAVLEDFLESLATLPHHINPELLHGEWRTEVQFPAYRDWLDDIRGLLSDNRFEGAHLRCTPMLEVLTQAPNRAMGATDVFPT